MPTRIIIDVKAGSKEESVEELGENWLLVRVKAQRKKGMANRAVLKLLKKYFKEDIRMVSGFNDSRKVIEIG